MNHYLKNRRMYFIILLGFYFVTPLIAMNNENSALSYIWGGLEDDNFEEGTFFGELHNFAPVSDSYSQEVNKLIDELLDTDKKELTKPFIEIQNTNAQNKKNPTKATRKRKKTENLISEKDSDKNINFREGYDESISAKNFWTSKFPENLFYIQFDDSEEIYILEAHLESFLNKVLKLKDQKRLVQRRIDSMTTTYPGQAVSIASNIHETIWKELGIKSSNSLKKFRIINIKAFDVDGLLYKYKPKSIDNTVPELWQKNKGDYFKTTKHIKCSLELV